MIAGLAGRMSGAVPLYAHLDQQFGSYKKAPDDHWIFNALNRIKDAKDYFPSVEEDGTD